MDIREFNYHQYLASLEYTKPILCFNDLDHGNLYANLDSEDNTYLYCLVCDFILHPGSEFSKLIRVKIKEVMTKEIGNVGN